MNNKRRLQLSKALAIIEDVRTEEEQAFHDMPESFQYGAAGEANEYAQDLLEECEDLLRELGA